MYYWTPDGRQILDGVAGLWCVNAGHGRREITEAVSRADRRDGLRAAVPDGSPGRLRTRERDRALAARRSRPRVLHQLGLGVGRHRAQDRARLPPRARRGDAHPPDRPRARLSRCRASAASPSAAWSTTASSSARSCRASITCRTRTTSRATPTRAASPAHGRAPRRRTRAHRRAARREQHRRRDRRAGRGLDRRADPAAGLPASGCARSARSTASCSSSTR